MKTLPIFVALHPSLTDGEALLGKHYSDFVNHLRNALRMSGFEDKASSAELLRFRFERLISALVAVHEALDTFRNSFLKNQKPFTLPVKFIFHYIEHKNSPLPAFCETGSPLWSSLQNEKLYVDRALKLKWPDLQEINKEIRCRFELEDEGVYLAVFAQKPKFSSERLFMYRHLLLNGTQGECYYCGMRSHLPAKCPSKMLTMDTQGIQHLGYLSFQQINDIFVKVFQNPGSVQSKLAAGITPSQLKSDHELLVYTAFFDLSRVFQPRFLHKIAFAKMNKWVDVTSNSTTKLILDDSNLNFGLDCLRVGKYDEAEEKFLAATGHQQPKVFYAYVGLALLALEKGRLQDMGHFLDTACSNASKEKEKVYIYLLLARYFKLTGNLWKAQNSLASLFKIAHTLVEANYLNALIEISSGFSEKAMDELRTTLHGPREYFMVLMLEPQLLPFHGFIDEILQAKREVINKGAREQLALARSAADDTLLWLEKDDAREKELTKTITDIQQQYDSSNLYDMFDVIENSRELCARCKEITENCLDEVTNKTKLLNRGFNKFVSFWNLFPYKSFFSKIPTQTNALKKQLFSLQTLAKKRTPEDYKRALALLVETENRMNDLQKSTITMKRVALMIGYLKTYVRKLILTESILLLVLLPLGLVLLPNSLYTVNASAKHNIFLITGLIFAPTIALALAVRELFRRTTPPKRHQNKPQKSGRADYSK